VNLGRLSGDQSCAGTAAWAGMMPEPDECGPTGGSMRLRAAGALRAQTASRRGTRELLSMPRLLLRYLVFLSVHIFLVAAVIALG
jgi:hypothetical protein